MGRLELKDNVILIAATNRSDILDPALLRPARFDRADRRRTGPTASGRRKILEVHTKGKPWRVRSSSTPSPPARRASPAPTRQPSSTRLPLLAARRGKKLIEQEEFEEGISG